MKSALEQIWLILRLDLRVRWRESRGTSRSRLAVALFAGFLYLGLHAFAAPFVLLARNHPLPAFEAIGWLVVAVLAATSSLVNLRYERDDSALLLASPFPPRSILIARILSQATAGVLPTAFFVTPAFNLAVFILGPRYLACYLVLIATATIASSFAFALALLLSRRFGARRVLVFVRVVGALLGVGIAMLGQLPRMLGKTGMASFGAHLPPVAEWPVLAQMTRAGHGSPLDLALVLALAACALWIVGRTCGEALLRGIQAGHESPSRQRRAGTHRWSGSLGRATYLKELRLLSRDPLVLVQMLSVVGPLLPMAFGWRGMGAAMLGMFACFLAQLGSSPLVQAATNQERCWDLLRGSPTPEVKLRIAKLLAGLTLPIALSAVLCIVLAALGRPGLALVSFLTSAVGAFAIGWLFVSRVRPIAAPSSRVVRPKFESADLGRLLVSLLIVGPSLGGIAALAADRTWLALGLLGATLLLCFLVFGLTQLREVEEWRLEALRREAASK